MKKFYLLLLSILCLPSLKATHIVGGQIQYKWISGNQYEFTLLFYKDCLGGSVPFPSSIKLCFFDKVTDQEALSRVIALDTIEALTLGDNCYVPINLCIEVGTYTDTITISSNPNGYYISHSNNARGSSINNIAQGTMTYYAEMPDPALHNSSPFFVNYPKGYWCADYSNKENLTAIDGDGDSLEYFLEEPLAGPLNSSVCTPRPYTKVTWKSGYSYPDSILGDSSSVSLDSTTGILAVNPSTLGLFVIAYRVEEWRAGVKIGEIRRDMQYMVMSCTSQPFSGSVDVSGLTLTSIDSNVTFQWVDCNNSYAVINGANAQSYTASSSGSYAVILTSGSCTDTSDCYTVSLSGIQEENLWNTLKINPNPVNDKLAVGINESGVYTVIIADALGRIVASDKHATVAKHLTIVVDQLPPGIYILQLSKEGMASYSRFVKE